MPAGDGFVSVEKMDNDPNLSCLPVIYITGDKTEDTTNNAERHGAFAVLRKPLDMQELLRVIKILMDSQNPKNQDDGELREVA